MLFPEAQRAVEAYADEPKVWDDDFDIEEIRAETRRLAARPVRGFGIVEPVAVRRP